MSEKPDEAVEMTEKPNIASTLNVNKEAAGSATNCNDKVVYLEPPVKSDIDDNEYRVLKLPNGLTVFLTSRPGHKNGSGGKRAESQGDNEKAASRSETSTKTTKFAAPGIVDCALTIDVGSFSNSDENPCIAELLSKVVLTASKKYPMPYNFDKFLQMQNIDAEHCDVDVYCEPERTLFKFTTQEICLREALNRFVNCFIEPALKTEVVEIEKKLDSVQILSDQIKLYGRVGPTRTRNHLFGTLASKCDNNPASHLIPGRNKVLHSQPSDTLLDAIEKFRKRHYSAHRMIASLEGKLSLDELEEYAQTYFSQIPGNDLPPIDFTRFTFDKCFDSPEFRMIYEIEAYCRQPDRLELHWSMPSVTGVYKTKPTNYLSWILQQSGKGSLIWYLRKKNWCIDLRCSTGNTCLEPNSIFSLFSLSLTVTDEGQENCKKILDAVYSYINLMRSEGPQQKIYDEIRKKSDSDFRCGAEYLTLPVSLTTHDYASADYLNGSIVLFEYDPAGIKQCLELMSPEKANIIVCQKKFGTSHSLSENWEEIRDRVENVKYRKSKIPKAWIKRWKNVEPLPDFKLAVVDDPTTLESDDSSQYPVKIHSNDLCEVYKRDIKLRGSPKVVNVVHYLYCIQIESAETAFMLDMFGDLLIPTAKQLMREGCSCIYNTVRARDSGLWVLASGPDKNALRTMETITRHAATLANDLTKSWFNFNKTAMGLEYTKHRGCPEKIATELMHRFEVSGYWSTVEKLDASSRVDFKKFKHFAKHFGDHVFVKCLFEGRFIASEVIENVRSCVRMLKCRPLLPNSRPQILFHEFPPGARCCRFQSIDSDDLTAVVNHYQFGHCSTRQDVIINFFRTILVAAELTSLRARRNLDDYNVRLIPGNSTNGYSLIMVKSQRETMTRVATIEATIEGYREALNGWFKDLTTTEWEKLKKAYKSSLEIRIEWGEIATGAYVFNRPTRDQKLLNELPIEDLKRSMMHLTSNESSIRKLSVQAISRREYAQGSAGARRTQSQIELNFLTNLPGEDVKPDEYYITDIAAYTRGLATFPFAR